MTNKPEVVFKNEPGIDAGGPFKEFITLAAREVFSPQNGLFKKNKPNGSKIMIDPKSAKVPLYEKHFEYAGFLIAYIIYF